MARIRSVHPGMASDEVYMQMSMAAKAAWPLLWTECDDQGIFEWKPIVLKARIFPADNVDFTAILDEYAELGCIRMAEVEGKAFGFVRNFCRYQRPKNPSHRYCLPPEQERYVGKKSIENGSPNPGLPHASPRPTGKPSQRKEEGGRVEEEEASELRSAQLPLDGVHEQPIDFDDHEQVMFGIGKKLWGPKSGGSLVGKLRKAVKNDAETADIVRTIARDMGPDDGKSYLIGIVKSRERSIDLTLRDRGEAW